MRWTRWTAAFAECELASRTATCDASAWIVEPLQAHLGDPALHRVSSARSSAHRPVHMPSACTFTHSIRPNSVTVTAGHPCTCRSRCYVDGRTSLSKTLFGLSVTSRRSGRRVCVTLTRSVDGYVFGFPDTNSLKFSRTPGAGGRCSSRRSDESGYVFVYSNSCTDTSSSMLACSGGTSAF